MRHRRGRGYGCMRGQLGRQGLRMTASREAVLDVLSRVDEHVSADDVYIEARKVNPKIGMTSVYRTLELLSKMGLVHKTAFGDGRARYELSSDAGGKEHHHHVVCEKCGKIINYDDFSREESDYFSGIEKQIEEKYGFKIKHHSVQYFGQCRECK